MEFGLTGLGGLLGRNGLLGLGVVLALGGRRYVLTFLISLLLAVGSFYGFYLGLGIKLPAGILEGVL